jgi:hypothetical protein
MLPHRIGEPFPESVLWTASQFGKKFAWGLTAVDKSQSSHRLIVSEQVWEYPVIVDEDECEYGDRKNVTFFFVLANPFKCKLGGYTTKFIKQDHFPFGESPSDVPSRFYPQLDRKWFAMVNVSQDPDLMFNASSLGFYNNLSASKSFQFGSCKPSGKWGSRYGIKSRR